MAKLAAMAEARASAQPLIPALVSTDEKWITFKISRAVEADYVREKVGENKRTGDKETRYGLTAVPVDSKGLAAGEVEIVVTEGDGTKKTGRFNLGYINLSFRGFKD